MRHSSRCLLLSAWGCAIAASVSAAEAPAQVPPKAIAAKDGASAAVGVQKPPIKTTVPATAVGNKGGENQYPGVFIPPPKPPKKEALEAAGALKAKTGQ